MRIVNRKEFLTLPVGTVYAEYQPCFISSIKVKDETWEYDFLCVCFDYIEPNANEDDGVDAMYAMQEDGSSRDIEKAIGRDGMFEEKQLFMIYEKEDIAYIVKCLTNYESCENQVPETAKIT